MSNFVTKILGDKQEWRTMERRANALPRDYRIVYGEMKSYMWRFTAGNGMDTVANLRDVLGVFEISAAQDKSVLDVTGEDVAAFCDERLRSITSCMDTRRASLNRDVAKKLAQ